MKEAAESVGGGRDGLKVREANDPAVLHNKREGKLNKSEQAEVWSRRRGERGTGKQKLNTRKKESEEKNIVVSR